MTLSPPAPNGTAGSATELQPLSVPASTTYAAVPGSDSILRIDPDGSQSTITGPFVSPSDVAVNSQGSVYVASPGNGAVYVTPHGTGTPQIVTTLAERPTGVAVDRNDNLYVTDPGTNSVLVPSNLPDSGLNNLNLNDPTGIAVDPRERYVADTGNNRVIRLTDVRGLGADDRRQRPQPSRGSGRRHLWRRVHRRQRRQPHPRGVQLRPRQQSVIPTYGLSDPTCVTIDQSGTIVVTDTGNNRVVEIPPDGSQLDLTSGVAATGAAIALPTNSLYVADNEQTKSGCPPGRLGEHVQITHGNDFCTRCPPASRSCPFRRPWTARATSTPPSWDLDNNFGDFIFELPPGGGQS